MKIFRHIALILTDLLIASCAIDEMWDGVGVNRDEEVVMTFKPKFEDFESVTKAIGDGTQVDRLLVHVYEADGASLKLVEERECERTDWGKLSFSFYYGRKYKVFFWAYNESGNAYTIADGGLKDGVAVNYPQDTDALDFDALEYLDAFYAVETVEFTRGTEKTRSAVLTRPFAQVNLVADKVDLLAANASKVEFRITVADQFVPDAASVTPTSEKTFTFTSSDNFQSSDVFDGSNVYLGTTYLFVPSTGKLNGTLSLYDAEGNILKGPSAIEIPVEKNKRTNLVFSGIRPSTPAWDDNKMEIPDPSDGWIHISTPEQLAALLLAGTTAETKVHICNDIDMSGMPETLWSGIAASSFASLTIDGGKYEGDVVGGTSVRGSNMIRKYNAPAFLATATNLTVRNLILDEVQVTSATGHVGTLVNELKGSSTFTQVIVSNSSAVTANGAAGGVVGYIERIETTKRSEKLDVRFESCLVDGTVDKAVATGSLAEGKFVGLLSGYDNDETLVFDDNCTTTTTCVVSDYVSSYTSQNQSCFMTATDARYDQYLGSEAYRRGTVNYGAQRIVPKWDGSTPDIQPIVESNSKLILSPYDLAVLQGGNHSAIEFIVSVDMGSEVFEPIFTLKTLNGNNATIYNLKIDTMQIEGSDSYGSAFIRAVSGGTIKDLIFDGANINAVHDSNGTSGNAYAGTLVATISGNSSVTGVHLRNGSLRAVCKMGGLIGRVSDGKLICSDCTVTNYNISNYKVPDTFKETFKEEAKVQTVKSIFGVNFNIDITATAEASFNSEGEVGGLLGFIAGSADIDDCSVSGTVINAYGQLDDTSGVRAKGTAKYKILLWTRTSNLDLTAAYTIAGRHVNKFIGDIRPTAGENVTIDNCTADAQRTQDDCFWNSHTCSAGTFDLVGCAYYIGGEVQMDGISMNTTFGESKGSVKINGTEILDVAVANIPIADVLADLIKT